MGNQNNRAANILSTFDLSRVLPDIFPNIDRILKVRIYDADELLDHHENLYKLKTFTVNEAIKKVMIKKLTPFVNDKCLNLTEQEELYFENELMKQVVLVLFKESYRFRRNSRLGESGSAKFNIPPQKVQDLIVSLGPCMSDEELEKRFIRQLLLVLNKFNYSYVFQMIYKGL